jgi:L-ascorbate metabolism protein UlaG (beta-lactamase superfamily)
VEIIWYGHSCFRLRDKDIVVVTDPYDKSLGLPVPRVRADVVTISHNHPDHNAIQNMKGEPVVFDSPGEYEIKGIFVTGTSSNEARQRPLDQENTIFVFEMDSLTVCHLGDLDHVPVQEQIEALGDVHVLLIPVGGVTTLNASQAAEVIRLLEPRIVIPMHYALPEMELKLDPVSKFFKEMGLREPAPEAALKASGSTLPEETQVVLLDYKH